MKDKQHFKGNLLHAQKGKYKEIIDFCLKKINVGSNNFFLYFEKFGLMKNESCYGCPNSVKFFQKEKTEFTHLFETFQSMVHVKIFSDF